MDKEKGGVGLVEETKQERAEMAVELKVQDKANKYKEAKKGRDIEITPEKVEEKSMKIRDETAGRGLEEEEEVVVTLQKEEGEAEGGEGGTLGEEGGVESWDAVLDMVNTLWDDGWDKGGAGGGAIGDADSLSGSLQRWPLLRPPIGFGGSHPPSSAASELSLTELERRARELDSDLEHLDLSQPLNQESYPALLEPQRERADMYQTHPGPQREKAGLHTGKHRTHLQELALDTRTFTPL